MVHFDWIKRHAERMPDKLALVDDHTAQQFTYEQLDRRINRFASFLRRQLEVQQGDRVSILAMNSASYYEILFACGRIGAILNTLNWRLSPPELEYILQDCSPKVLIYEPEFSETVNVLLPGLGKPGCVILADTASSTAWAYEETLASSSPAAFSGPRLTYDDTWAIIYTSGTTGRPKGAQVTYGNFFYNAVGMGQAIDLTSRDVNLNVLPTFHIGGLGLFACPTFHAGGTVILQRTFDIAQLLQLIERWQVTVILLVPAMYLMLAQHPQLEQADLSSIRHWTSGGSALPPALLHEFADKGIVIQQGFGMTETGPTVFLIDKENAVRKAGSVGKPVLHTDVSIMDRQRNQLGSGEIGELCIRGGNVISSYWNRPQATTESIIDGWLHSGDAAMFDEDGYYFIVDRWKDMFISGGENVYPAEVENVLYQHPAVAEAAVIGVADPRWQEVGKAIVVVKEGQTLTEDELISFCQGKLARYKIVKSVEFTNSLPRTAAGKVLKRELKQNYG
jgi:fatty-acyl-CoA synthase